MMTTNIMRARALVRTAQADLDLAGASAPSWLRGLPQEILAIEDAYGSEAAIQFGCEKLNEWWDIEEARLGGAPELVRMGFDRLSAA